MTCLSESKDFDLDSWKRSMIGRADIYMRWGDVFKEAKDQKNLKQLKAVQKEIDDCFAMIEKSLERVDQVPLFPCDGTIERVKGAKLIVDAARDEIKSRFVNVYNRSLFNHFKMASMFTVKSGSRPWSSMFSIPALQALAVAEETQSEEIREFLNLNGDLHQYFMSKGHGSLLPFWYLKDDRRRGQSWKSFTRIRMKRAIEKELMIEKESTSDDIAPNEASSPNFQEYYNDLERLFRDFRIVIGRLSVEKVANVEPRVWVFMVNFFTK